MTGRTLVRDGNVGVENLRQANENPPPGSGARRRVKVLKNAATEVAAAGRLITQKADYFAAAAPKPPGPSNAPSPSSTQGARLGHDGNLAGAQVVVVDVVAGGQPQACQIVRNGDVAEGSHERAVLGDDEDLPIGQIEGAQRYPPAIDPIQLQLAGGAQGQRVDPR